MDIGCNRFFLYVQPVVYGRDGWHVTTDVSHIFLDDLCML
jgi:hypothetical protein